MVGYSSILVEFFISQTVASFRDCRRLQLHNIVKSLYETGMNKREYEVGGPNVFEDIGVPNAEEHLVKAKLVFKIQTIMRRRRLTQAEAAGLFGLKQPVVSKMV